LISKLGKPNIGEITVDWAQNQLKKKNMENYQGFVVKIRVD